MLEEAKGKDLAINIFVVSASCNLFPFFFPSGIRFCVLGKTADVQYTLLLIFSLFLYFSLLLPSRDFLLKAENEEKIRAFRRKKEEKKIKPEEPAIHEEETNNTTFAVKCRVFAGTPRSLFTVEG